MLLEAVFAAPKVSRYRLQHLSKLLALCTVRKGRAHCIFFLVRKWAESRPKKFFFLNTSPLLFPATLLCFYPNPCVTGSHVFTPKLPSYLKALPFFVVLIL